MERGQVILKKIGEMQKKRKISANIPIFIQGESLVDYTNPVSYTHLDVYKRQDIKFILEKSDESTYCLTPNIDVYGYDIFYGKNYSYFSLKTIRT